jgi:B12-binding domain/radical SAM domain protein
MRVNWREINAANNTFAVLSAACEGEGFELRPVHAPEKDITCYSLNSLNYYLFREEITTADSITIVGGPHASACYRAVVCDADYVVVGEGEKTLPSLLYHIESGKGEIPPGVATRKMYRPAPYSVRLDAYPPFSSIKGYIEISRGCPHHCGYCQTPRIFGHLMRHRSIDTIRQWAQKYRDIRLVSPNAFAYGSDGRVPRWDKVEHLLAALKGNIFFGTFPSEVRPEFITDRGLELVSAYCSNTRLAFGAQSGSDQVLISLGRGHTVRDVEIAIDRCREFGITPIVDFILGLPMETDEDQGETLKMIQGVARKGQVRVHRFLPLPGTPLAQTRPRPLLPHAEKMLGRLALKGTLTGSWSGGDTILYPPARCDIHDERPSHRRPPWPDGQIGLSFES